MLAQYFEFREEPFGATPDPRWLYRSAQYRDALASLRFGFRSNRGFSALIAPPGMGKTTLLYQFLHDIRSSARIVFVFDTQCGPQGLLRYILRDLGVTPASNSDEMHAQLENILFSEARSGRTVVVVIDEAQNLSDASLEMLRLLTNYETPQAKLVHIVLSGQPDLADTLTKPSNEQLRQRVTASCWLEPFSVEETTAYIRHRLEQAGYQGAPLFRKDALRRIMLASHGIPRIINNLCFNALCLCLEQKLKQVDGRLAAEAIAIQELDPAAREKITDRWLHAAEPSLHFDGLLQPEAATVQKIQPEPPAPPARIEQLLKAEPEVQPAVASKESSPLESLPVDSNPEPLPTFEEPLEEPQPVLLEVMHPLLLEVVQPVLLEVAQPVQEQPAQPVMDPEPARPEPVNEFEPVPKPRELFAPIRFDEEEVPRELAKGRLAIAAAVLFLVASGIGQLTLPARWKPWSRLMGNAPASASVPPVTRIQAPLVTTTDEDATSRTSNSLTPITNHQSDDQPAAAPISSKVPAGASAVSGGSAKAKPAPGQSLSPLNSSPARSGVSSLNPPTRDAGPVPSASGKPLPAPALTPSTPIVARPNVGETGGQKIWLPSPEPASVAQPAALQSHLSPTPSPGASAPPASANNAMRPPAIGISVTPDQANRTAGSAPVVAGADAGSNAKTNKVAPASITALSGTNGAANRPKVAPAGLPPTVKRPGPTQADVAPLPADVLSRPIKPIDPEEENASNCGGISGMPCPKLHTRSSEHSE